MMMLTKFLNASPSILDSPKSVLANGHYGTWQINTKQKIMSNTGELVPRMGECISIETTSFSP